VSIISIIIVRVLGTQNLLIASGFGMAVTMTVINNTFGQNSKDELFTIFLIFIFIIFYSFGYGIVPWMLMAELSPQKV